MYYAKLNTLWLLGGLSPPDPFLQRYNSRVSPSPQEILDPPLYLSQKLQTFHYENLALYGISLNKLLDMTALLIFTNHRH